MGRYGVVLFIFVIIMELVLKHTIHGNNVTFSIIFMMVAFALITIVHYVVILFMKVIHP